MDDNSNLNEALRLERMQLISELKMTSNKENSILK